jgi:hypothetical protein
VAPACVVSVICATAPNATKTGVSGLVREAIGDPHPLGKQAFWAPFRPGRPPGQAQWWPRTLSNALLRGMPARPAGRDRRPGKPGAAGKLKPA